MVYLEVEISGTLFGVWSAFQRCDVKQDFVVGKALKIQLPGPPVYRPISRGRSNINFLHIFDKHSVRQS